MASDKATEVVSKLQELNNQQLHFEEKQSKYRELVLNQHNGDVCAFILSLTGIPLSQMIIVVSLLEDFHLDAGSFTLSPQLPETLALFTSYDPDQTLASKVISWLKAVNHEAVTTGLPKANVLAMGEYVLRYIPSENVGLADTACALFGNLMKYHYDDLGPLYGFGRQFSDNSQVYLRFLTVYSKVSTLSEEHFKAVFSAGAIRDIQQICKTNDLLLQINAIELILDIASTQCGLQYLCEYGTIKWLIDISCGTPTAPVDPLLSGETLRILGGVFAKASERSFDFVHYVDATSVQRFLDTLMGYFEERDEANRVKGVGILSDFATISYSTFSMVMTHANGRLVGEWLDLLNAAKPELIGAVLHSIARVVNHEEEKYVANDTRTLTAYKNLVQTTADAKDANISVPQVEESSVTELKKRLMNAITQARGVHFITYLLKTARLPVPSVRHAALDLLAAVASQPSGWGLLSITQAPTPADGGPDFTSYITNRETEFSKEGKEWKYSLIKAIAVNPSRGHLSDEFNAKIDHMVAQGPYFMPHRMADMQTI